MRIIAFFSQKGGCGKTTACVNLAAVLASLGRRVLVLDLDSNACASRTFNALETFENSIAAALVGHTPLAEVIRPTPIETLWLAPGATHLHAIENLEGLNDTRRLTPTGKLSEGALALELSELAPDSFDYVFLDCPGGYPFMEHLVLLAASEVIVPTGLSVYDLYAATPSLQLIVQARSLRGDVFPRFLGFLPNGASKSGVAPKMQAKLDTYGLPCFSPIRHSALLKTIAGHPRPEQRLLVFARPESPVTASYRQVAHEIEEGAPPFPNPDSSPPTLDEINS